MGELISHYEYCYAWNEGRAERRDRCRTIDLRGRF
jgi:hypothetical protein